MGAYNSRMLLMQGYGREDIALNENLNPLARWTPFACRSLRRLWTGLGFPALLVGSRLAV